LTGRRDAAGDPVTDEELGKIAYEAFRDYLDGTQQWSGIWEREREAWEAAAGCVADAVRASRQYPDGQP
jgi:hypothetical protein